MTPIRPETKTKLTPYEVVERVNVDHVIIRTDWRNVHGRVKRSTLRRVLIETSEDRKRGVIYLRPKWLDRKIEL